MKNPFMSMWLSQANAWSGAMRGFWSAEMHRQQTQMMQEMTKQMMQFWVAPGRCPRRRYRLHAERLPIVGEARLRLGRYS